MASAKHTSASWQDSLKAFLEANPDMPPGAEESTVNVTENDAIHVSRTHLDIIYERKGRAGKPATIISGFGDDCPELPVLASSMKQKMGCGGSARGGEILLQGDRRQEALDFLTAKGYKARII